MPEQKEIKALYAAKAKPAIVMVPKLRFVLVEGVGDPNGDAFGGAVGALYSFSYAVRMSGKGGDPPPGFYEYTVSPLEGVWDLHDKGKPITDKSNYRWQAMIRQPDFLTPALYERFLAEIRRKKPSEWLDRLQLADIEEGTCCQMLHLGSYDAEPASFALMEAFCREQGWRRKAKTHREIYLSNPGRTEPDKLKTILRFLAEPEAASRA